MKDRPRERNGQPSNPGLGNASRKLVTLSSHQPARGYDLGEMTREQHLWRGKGWHQG